MWIPRLARCRLCAKPVVGNALEILTRDGANRDVGRRCQSAGIAQAAGFGGGGRHRIAAACSPPRFSLPAREAGVLEADPLLLVAVQADLVFDAQRLGGIQRRTALLMNREERVADHVLSGRDLTRQHAG